MATALQEACARRIFVLFMFRFHPVNRPLVRVAVKELRCLRAWGL